MAILLKLIINILNRFETVWDRFGPPKPETKLFQTDWDFPKPNHLKWFGFSLNRVWIGFKPNFPNTSLHPLELFHHLDGDMVVVVVGLCAIALAI
jgi:hypothetical protein